ncbi:RsmB/NOP family class I SAM-dependent RNA methyltransferase [Paenibacillus lentus]|uniref:RNA methyltransferase n=1 Tax=Paenibacillus lentus TaxID=1338368 RepID=A0A3Q8SD85_9BACL|nr:RsmB/NOP family class I SAM-dependent RNA methyltransferase [Paenibacillus lentus]AZK47988.1 RNA methyltransferase [Paenibacillus lentus]
MSKTALPTSFRSIMISMLGEVEGQAFLASYDKPRTYGLRINTLKIQPGSIAERDIKQHFGLKEVPWCEDGYYYDQATRPGKHPYHAAGLYYIQEPSAMSAVEWLAPQPGETVLDLAAAPGGKTTQIAMKMAGKGLLISNEIHPQRAKVLAENVERFGARNVVVTQATPDELSARFPLAFDRIMLDAPCSGEGMFRKDPDAISEWSPQAVDLCAARQWDILKEAVAMLKPGGRLAYSTCTFNRQENENTIARLLEQYPDLKLLREKRIWPHKHQGEGHYVALLQRDQAHALTNDIVPDQVRLKSKQRGKKGHKESFPQKVATAAYEVFLDWAKNDLPGLVDYLAEGMPILFGESLYWLPSSAGLQLTPQSLEGLRIPRAGLHLGDLKKGRFQPAHALAMATTPNDAAQVWILKIGSTELSAYFHGDTLTVPEHYRGWCLVAVECDGEAFPIGWGKASGGQLKNHLPKGLRQPVKP